MRIFVFVLTFFPLFCTLFAQEHQAKPAITAPNYLVNKFNIQSPKGITASDGTYEDFILVRWEPSENGTLYKVFRSNTPKANSLQEVSNAWQKSTWVCDYSALPNVDYYYTVVATDGKQTSAVSTFDKGFLKKRQDIAIDERELLVEAEVYGEGKQIFLLISDITLSQTTITAGSELSLVIGLQNIFDQPTVKTDLRFYLSSDAILDWNDKLLDTRSLSSVPANVNFSLSETVTLPKDLLVGQYNLIVVSSSEGAIISSKTIQTSLKIIEK